MAKLDSGTWVTWDITYACPLRCGYCYSESGRRASRTLDETRIMQVADALIAAGVRIMGFAGGEPTLVPSLAAVAQKLRTSGVATHLFTNGVAIDDSLYSVLPPCFKTIHVSIDGVSADGHDRVRGKRGSFETAIHSLGRYIGAKEECPSPLRVGIDYTVIRSNFDEMAQFCTQITHRFPAIDFIAFGAAVPAGVGSRRSYAAAELLENSQLEMLRDDAFVNALSTDVPASTTITVTDNWDLLPKNLSDPDKRASFPIMIEPDGAVRAFPAYEGTIGNILDEPLEAIWERAATRHRDEFIIDVLSRVTTMQDWAAATRLLDQRFASTDDLARIRKRGERDEIPGVR